MENFKVAAMDFVRFARFQRVQGDVGKHMLLYLLMGLAITLLVGIGRRWDHPESYWLLRTGLGSLIYVFGMSAFIYAVVAPLRPKNWRYLSVLLMVTMTALPALLYAIPVERFMPAVLAAELNVLALIVVATWRMALYRHFLERVGGLSGLALWVALLLPATLIVCLLSLIGLMERIASSMGGVDEIQRAVVGEYLMLIVGGAAWIAIVPLLGLYGFAIFRAWRTKNTPQR